MLRLFETDLETFTYCGKHVQHLISLHRLSLSPRIMDALKELGLEAPCICTRPVVFFNAKSLAKKEVYWRLSWHQDWRTMQGSLDSVIVWIPLVDIDQRLGAIEVIPGATSGVCCQQTLSRVMANCAERLMQPAGSLWKLRREMHSSSQHCWSTAPEPTSPIQFAGRAISDSIILRKRLLSSVAIHNRTPTSRRKN